MTTITLKRTTSTDPNFKTLTAELDADLRLRNGEVMDLYDQHNIIEQIDTVIVAYINNVPAGCGCFKYYDNHTVEIKRMYVRPEARGNQVSRRVLNELEAWARELGFRATVLETAGKQVEAQSLYHKSGYERVPNYGPYANLPDSLCYRKQL
ncbi:GNAT family N-acetyltransferase [Mucilaginibacter celer]|uniref:GNAT family N-acetyltransferase n=1 Tax=Mucilaginibacter celer TaxID=2305508 RepID=A0A494VMS1_9SPHI|nr:GNAT family N-acetyltransferase [Mucilaginibacter celer]AYL96637.1 GNAT family N-acetyltransferase [Mucilaginibacter celer]